VLNVSLSRLLNT